MDLDEALVAALKANLRDRGFYLRYTEWPLGHQVMLHARADTARALVTDWYATELDAWRAALRLADQAAPAAEACPPPDVH